MTAPEQTPLVEVAGLTVTIGDKTVLRGVNLNLAGDEVLGIVGETGAGKSVLARSLIRLLPENARIEAGDVRVLGQSVAGLRDEELRQIRGGRVALIGTDAKSLLDPVRTVGDQVADVLRAHRRIGRVEARKAAIE